MKRKNNIPTSSYSHLSSGHLETSIDPHPYFVTAKLDTAVVPIEFSHEGSNNLDAIVAFDSAETTGSYMGQINMITASSFCAPFPQGILVGYDVLRSAKEFAPHPLIPEGIITYENKSTSVVSLDPLYDAGLAIFGTKSTYGFPLSPGSHTISACKTIGRENAHIYCALGIAIPENRYGNNSREPAILFMEDTGTIVTKTGSKKEVLQKKRYILEAIARSCIRISNNHPNTNYSMIFVGMKDVIVPKGMIGCALVALPYFSLAQQAIPRGGLKKLASMSSESWISWKNKRRHS